MSLCKAISLSKDIYLQQHRLISTTLLRPLIQKWRKERGLPTNPVGAGFLADKPDYTFLDGRPTPYGSEQMKRILKHRELTRRIIQLTAEMDNAVVRHKQITLDEANNKRNIIENKLKPKGNSLLK